MTEGEVRLLMSNGSLTQRTFGAVILAILLIFSPDVCSCRWPCYKGGCSLQRAHRACIEWLDIFYKDPEWSHLTLQSYIFRFKWARSLCSFPGIPEARASSKVQVISQAIPQKRICACAPREAAIALVTGRFYEKNFQPCKRLSAGQNYDFVTIHEQIHQTCSWREAWAQTLPESLFGWWEYRKFLWRHQLQGQLGALIAQCPHCNSSWPTCRQWCVWKAFWKWCLRSCQIGLEHLLRTLKVWKLQKESTHL